MLLKYNEFLLTEANVWRNQKAVYQIHPNNRGKAPNELLEFTFGWSGENRAELESPNLFWFRDTVK